MAAWSEYSELSHRKTWQKMSNSLGGGKTQINVIQTTSCESYHLPREELLVVVQIGGKVTLHLFDPANTANIALEQA